MEVIVKDKLIDVIDEIFAENDDTSPINNIKKIINQSFDMENEDMGNHYA